ncbi:MAG: mechanosensitive ion channel family protein [Polyangia bacterium]
MTSRAAARLLLIFFLTALSATARGEDDFGEGPEPDTPRHAVERFLDAVHEGRYTDAAEDLYLRPENKPLGTELVRKLAAVLDTQMSNDGEWLSRVTDLPDGSLKDGLPPEKEEIGRVPGRRASEPVRMRRVLTAAGTAHWKFTDGTAMRARQWYQRLPNRWLREHLPRQMTVPGPRGILLWEWLALPLFLALSVMIGLLVAVVLTWTLLRLARRTKAHWDDLLVTSLRRPLALTLTSLLLGWVLRFFLITAQASGFMSKLARVGVFLGLFWASWKCVDVAVQVIRRSRWLKSHPSALGFIPLGYRLAEITVLAIALILALQELGYPVTSLVAGLGLGGLALALAAQKTVEHLLGGVMLSLDQPIRIGDAVLVEGRQGWVEHIGLRSTSIRTLDRSLLTIPNGKLADMVIESLAARDNLRLHFVLGVTYDLKADKLDALRSRLLAYLRAHPRLWSGQQLRCHFAAFGSSSLDIEIMAWFCESDWDRFLDLRHGVLIDVMRILEEEGAEVAFPTHTVHLLPIEPIARR